jgi:pimeloyl-ACP methyl ester carboxylesterase
MEPARSGSVVLVHGLWGNAHDWRWVREHLERAEVDVLAVDLPSHRMPTAGLLEDAATVREAIRQSEPPVVVAGWSYGGTVVSVACRRAVVRHATGVRQRRALRGARSRVQRLDRPDPNVLTYPDGTFVLNNDWWLDEEAGTTFPAEVRQELRQHPRRRVSRKAMSDPQPAAAWQTIPSTLVLGRHDDQPGANDLDAAIARFQTPTSWTATTSPSSENPPPWRTSSPRPPRAAARSSQRQPRQDPV